MTTRAQIIELVQSDIESAQKALAKWAKDFAENPLYALRWGDKAVDAAAEQEVLTVCLQYLEADQPDAEVAQALLTHAMDAVFRGLNAGVSTSSLSNQTERAVAQRWSKVADQNGWSLGAQLRKLVAAAA